MIENLELSEPSVLAAATAFLAERYPELVGEELAGVQLGSGWLIETEPTTGSGEEPSSKVVLMVNRHGFVEEVGAAADGAPGRPTLLGRACRPLQSGRAAAGPMAGRHSGQRLAPAGRSWAAPRPVGSEPRLGDASEDLCESFPPLGCSFS